MNRVYAVIAFFGMISSNSIAGENPLDCDLSSQGEGGVNCSVVADKARIDEVTLNRGNCSSPTPSAGDRAAVNRFLSSMSAKEQEVFKVIGLGAVGALMVQNPQLAISYLKVNSDPIGTHKFGDQISIMNTCKLESSKLIEFSVVVDGNSWTWKMH